MLLRDYQQEMLERLRLAWERHRSVMVQMPTGTGKTHVLAAAVKGELCRDEKACVWVVAHRRELVCQIVDKLKVKGEREKGTDGAASAISSSLEYCRVATEEDRRLIEKREKGKGEREKGIENREKIKETRLEETLRSAKNREEDDRVRVVSIQWLARNGYDAGGKPTLIVIDEAHHALADTYRELWKRYPEAKMLGMTATPCRLNNRGFGDLFEELLQSWTVKEFINRGVLSGYEYVRADAEDDKEGLLLAKLQKRGADGDFQVKEMDMVLNRTESIRRLYESMVRHAGGSKATIKKGIVYAISIAHARAIAEFYSDKGIASVAIDSKTPATERKEKIEAFKAGMIRVLVNVDVFSEGFDCPDVEFVQLARPTLSLAKYLQQVGRGLRKAAGKDGCIIIDNVGLHRFFGMPDRDWDWQALFEGRLCGKAVLPDGSKASRYIGDDFLQGWDKRGEVYYEDLRTGRRYTAKPKVLRYGSEEDLTEVLMQDDLYYSRTKEPYVNRTRMSNHTPIWRGWYLLLPDRFPPKGYLFMTNINYSIYAQACWIAGDDEEVYWLCVRLADGSIVIMDKNASYYHTRQGGEKVLIGCTRTKQEEKELLQTIEELTKQAKRQHEEAQQRKKKMAEVAREERLNDIMGAEPFRIGLKWGLKQGERIVVPPKYRMVLTPVGRYCAFEESPRQWGVMAVDGRIEIDARYQKVDIGRDNMVTLTVYPGKVKVLKLK